MRTSKDRTNSTVARIKEKYGTITAFCKSTGRDRYQMQKFFANCRHALTSSRIADLKVIESEINVVHSNFIITAAMRAKVLALSKKVGRKKLAEDTGVSVAFVTFIITGRTKLLTTFVKKFFKQTTKY